MLGRFGRWTIDLAVAFFALYAFVFLPLGEKSAWDHLRAIASSEAAVDAGREIVRAGDRLRGRILGGGDAPIDTQGSPVVPELPAGEPVQMRVEPASFVITGATDAGADASL